MCIRDSHYHIIVETRGGMDALIVETELRPEAFRDSFEAMDALRAAADDAETVCGEDYWPLPSYSKMLYYV